MNQQIGNILKLTGLWNRVFGRENGVLQERDGMGGRKGTSYCTVVRAHSHRAKANGKKNIERDQRKKFKHQKKNFVFVFDQCEWVIKSGVCGEGGGGTSCVDPAVCRVVARDADRFCAAGAAGAALCDFPVARTSVRWLHLVAASGNRTQASDSTSTKTTALQTVTSNSAIHKSQAMFCRQLERCSENVQVPAPIHAYGHVSVPQEWYQVKLGSCEAGGFMNSTVKGSSHRD